MYVNHGNAKAIYPKYFINCAEALAYKVCFSLIDQKNFMLLFIFIMCVNYSVQKLKLCSHEHLKTPHTKVKYRNVQYCLTAELTQQQNYKVDLSVYSTPSIPEIIWVRNVRAIVVCRFLLKSLKTHILKFKKKLWVPFGRYLLNSTANPAHFHSNWAGLALLFFSKFQDIYF